MSYIVITTKTRAFVIAEASMYGINLDEGEKIIYKGDRVVCLEMANNFNRGLSLSDWVNKNLTPVRIT